VITQVVMPQMGLEVNEATVLRVLVGVGEVVAKDDPLFEVETEKATVEVVAPRMGVVVGLNVEIGDLVPVGGLLATLGDEREERSDNSTTKPMARESDSGKVARPAATLSATHQETAVDTRPIRAAPAARRLAAEHGIALQSLSGSGPRGRITVRDVERAREVDKAGGATSATELLSRRRAVIARRMTESQQIPQYALQRDIDASELLEQKVALAASTPAAAAGNIGITDLLIQAIGEMVVRHPVLAEAFVESPAPAVLRHPRVGVGLAVASTEGLVVPVVHDVPACTLGEIGLERRRLTDIARAGKLTPLETSGGVVTLSNLGGYGIDRFAAMLNPGESAIVAVGRMIDRVVPAKRGIAVLPMLTLAITFDHRVVDGAIGATALADLAELLEGGMTWRP
jgi:pyruvate dehydrogenase E2 component (dihydrolipoamide acetyltransferase)